MSATNLIHPKLSAERNRVMRRALVLEWITIGVLATTIAAMYLAAGDSRAMRTALWEDILSLVPPLVFLIGLRIEKKPPTRDYPYGYRNIATINFVATSSALVILGGWLLIAAIVDLVGNHRPSIGTMQVFGRTIWAGWAMIAAVTYSVAPLVLLGRLKRSPAEILHDKTLAADADMNKADWMTGIAAAVGVAGIGLGWWWVDPLAAAFVSISILHDGLSQMKRAVRDLMDHVPTGIDGRPLDVGERVKSRLRSLPWVEDAAALCRQEGRFILVEAELKPAPGHGSPEELRAATREIRELDWKIDHVIVSPTLESRSGDDAAP